MDELGRTYPSVHQPCRNERFAFHVRARGRSMSATDPVVIVGAGPAGVSAARALVEAGHEPILIDEGMFPGGQIFRRAPAPLARSGKDTYGFEATRAHA